MSDETCIGCEKPLLDQERGARTGLIGIAVVVKGTAGWGKMCPRCCAAVQRERELKDERAAIAKRLNQKGVTASEASGLYARLGEINKALR